MAFHLNGTNKKHHCHFTQKGAQKAKQNSRLERIAGDKGNFGITMVMICYRPNVLYEQENLEVRHNSSITFKDDCGVWINSLIPYVHDILKKKQFNNIPMLKFWDCKKNKQICNHLML